MMMMMMTIGVDQSRVEAYSTGFPIRLFLYPVPSAAARTAPNGVKERASFCLVFRSLNTTSSHRMFSMGYRRAKSTQGNTNFQKRFFWRTTSGSLPAGLKQDCRKSILIKLLPWTKKTATTIMHKIRTLFLSWDIEKSSLIALRCAAMREVAASRATVPIS